MKDAFGNPVAGVNVNWVAATGGGSVSAATVATAVNGTSSVIRTLGATVGAQTTTASAAGTTPASVTFNSTGTALVSAYSITVRYLTPMIAGPAGGLRRRRGPVGGDHHRRRDRRLRSISPLAPSAG